MVSLITLLLFFIYLLGLGYTVLSAVGKPSHWGERIVLYLSIGLGTFPLLAILLNLLHIPLDWKVFLMLSTAFPLYSLYKHRSTLRSQLSSFSFKLNKLHITKSSVFLAGAVLISLLSLVLYTQGAFSYPYLEDEDPWGHAVGAKYVALEKTAYDPPVMRDNRTVDVVLSYIDPYPPAYDILMGILHQTSPDLNWTLKFFNALIISLGILFFYLFAKQLMNDGKKALLATFILASIPSYLSHFIWAHAYVITLFFPALYAFEKTKSEPRWMYITALIVGSIWVTQNIEQPLKITMMIFLYLIIVSVISRHWFVRGFIGIFSGIALSFLWWGGMLHKYTVNGFFSYFRGDEIASSLSEQAATAVSSVTSVSSVTAGSVTFLPKLQALLLLITSPGGSGSRAYTLQEFFFARNENLINAPIGIGIVISLFALLAIIYLLYHHKTSLVTTENWYIIAIFWFLFMFWAVNGKTFPFSIARAPFRSWFLLAIPIALLAAEGVFIFQERICRFFGTKQKMTKTVLISLVLIGIIMTSMAYKYNHNTSPWPTSGTFSSGPAEPALYAQWFATLPYNTNIFLYSPRDKIVIGWNGFSCDWCQDVLDFRKNILDRNAEELYSFLQQHDYEYLVLNPRMDLKYFSPHYEQTQQKLQSRYDEIISSGHFQPVSPENEFFVVLKVL